MVWEKFLAMCFNGDKCFNLNILHILFITPVHLLSFQPHFAPLCLHYPGFDSRKDSIDNTFVFPLIAMKRLGSITDQKILSGPSEFERQPDGESHYFWWAGWFGGLYIYILFYYFFF